MPLDLEEPVTTRRAPKRGEAEWKICCCFCRSNGASPPLCTGVWKPHCGEKGTGRVASAGTLISVPQPHSPSIS